MSRTITTSRARECSHRTLAILALTAALTGCAPDPVGRCAVAVGSGAALGRIVAAAPDSATGDEAFRIESRTRPGLVFPVDARRVRIVSCE